jgi:peroxiredoxin
MTPFAAPPTTLLVTALLVVIAVAAMLGWLCYRLLVDRGHLLLRLSDGETAGARAVHRARGLPAGAYLSDFALPALSGAEAGTVVALSGLIGRPLLLAFLRADCLFSRAFAREFASQPPGVEAPLTVSILVGDVESSAAWEPFSELPGLVLLDTHEQVARLMRIKETPSGYRIGADRRTVGLRVSGPVELLAAARGETPPSGGGGHGGEQGPPSGEGEAITAEEDTPTAVTPLPARPSSRLTPLPPGTPAPDFTLPLLGGGEWSLGAQRGAAVALLFADPSCPPCQTLLAALRGCEAPGLVIVSHGHSAEIRRLVEERGITPPVLLQRRREVARAFGTLETPAAFLIDADGVIVGGPAVGKEAVLALFVQPRSGTMRRTRADFAHRRHRVRLKGRHHD